MKQYNIVETRPAYISKEAEAEAKMTLSKELAREYIAYINSNNGKKKSKTVQ